MRITNQMLANQLKKMISTSTVSQGNGQSLKVGAEFTAKIANIFNNTLTLELSPGKFIEALDISAASYQEGEVAEFVVTDQDDNGRVYIKALTPEVAEKLQNKVLLNIIAETSFKPTSENLDVVKELMSNKIPVTDENIRLIINTKAHFEKTVQLAVNNDLDLTGDKLNQDIKSVLVDHIKQENQQMVKGELNSQVSTLTNESGENPQSGQIQDVNITKEENSEILIKLKPELESNQPLVMTPKTSAEKEIHLEKESKPQMMIKEELNLKEGSNLKENTSQAVNQEQTKSNVNLQNKASALADKPISEEAVKELSNIVKQLNPEKLVFLMKNQMDFSLNNLKQMENLLLGKQKLTEQIEALTSKLENENPKSEIVKQLKSVMNGLELTDLSDKSKVETGLKNISEALLKVNMGATMKSGSEGLRSQLTEIKNSVEFLNQLNDQMTFLQIPVQFNEQSNNIDIFIQRDSSGKRKINPKDTKVFISLDTKHLQLVQVLIEIKDKNISLNFRIENEQVENLLKNNDELLIPSMNAIGFDNVKFNYAITEEKMDLTNMVRLESADTVNKIDMRV